MNPNKDNYIGESEVFLEFQKRLADAAAVNRSVLIIGERGSGKEMAASRLHYLSSRWQKNFITVNCATLAPTLIESELFGYEKGAFTGADRTHKGRFEEAQGGTLFLDEIGLIPMQVQEKILRVVEYGTYERVGSSITNEADVRIIGATNADLKELVAEGRFKQDLLDRLSFEVIYLPPLRFRGDDILILANYFAQKMAMECGMTETPYFSPEVQEQLDAYNWPGNVRELKNVVERAVYRSGGSEIRTIQLDPFVNPFKTLPKGDFLQFSVPALTEAAAVSSTDTAAAENTADTTGVFDSLPLDSLEQSREQLERNLLSRALQKSGGSQKEAAELMNISYNSFRGLYRKYKTAGKMTLKN